MSEVKRYDMDDFGGGMIAREDGAYYHCDDYAALEAELTEAKRQVAILRQHKTDYMEAAEGTRKALEAECERLREERDSFQRVGIRTMEERDALAAELHGLRFLIGAGEEVGRQLQQNADVERIRADALAAELENCKLSWGLMRAELAAIKGQEPVAWAADAALAKLQNRRNNSPTVLTDGPTEFNTVALYRLPPTTTDVQGLVTVLAQAVEYLDCSAMESINSGSVLHQRMSAALAAHKTGAME